MIPTISELLQLTLTPAAVLSIIGAFVNIYLLYLLNSRPDTPKSAKWLNFMVFYAVFWGFLEALNRSSNNVNAGIFWESLSWMGWIFMGPTTLGFADSYTGRNKLYSKFINQLIFFGPGLIITYLGWTTNLLFDRDPSHWERLSYGQWVTHTGILFDTIGLAYVSVLVSIGIFQIYLAFAKSKDKNKKIQALALLIGIAIPVLGGSITNGLMMIIYNNNIFRLGSVWITMGDSVMVFGVLRYRLFVVNPATFVDNIVATVNEILLVLNTDHIIEYTNKAVETILGYPKEELIGQNISILLGTQSEVFFDKILNPIEKGSLTSVHSVETELTAITGKKIPVSFSISPYKDTRGKVVSTIQVVSDIRQLKELLNITAERNKLKAMMESISDGVLALDTSGNVILVNSSASNMLSLYSQDILGKPLTRIIRLFDIDNKSIEPSDLLPKIQNDQETLVLKKPEIKVITVNGKQLYINLISSVIKEGNQVGLGAIITLHNISEEKALEEMKLDFVSMAAHELRTPLTIIIGYLSLYIKNYGSKLDVEQKKYIDRMDQATQNLRVLTENLLNVTRIERGTLMINLGLMEWTEFVSQTVSTFQDIAKNKKIDLQFIPPNQIIPPVYADKVRMGEVIGNLIDNAIKYTEINGAIRIGLEVNNDFVITHIADNGRGIPPEVQPYLFTKFFRASKNLVQSSGGTGLGLYISKAIVEKHQGKIWVQSIPRRGSVFSFSLPIQYKPPIAQNT